jgi:hypothetical protein
MGMNLSPRSSWQLLRGLSLLHYPGHPFSVIALAAEDVVAIDALGKRPKTETEADIVA